MTKRSFTKEKDLPNPNIKYTRATGNYFGNTGLSNLSELGQRIISGYMTLNEVTILSKFLLEKTRRSQETRRRI